MNSIRKTVRIPVVRAVVEIPRRCVNFGHSYRRDGAYWRCGECGHSVLRPAF
jgi:hypothetical protein